LALLAGVLVPRRGRSRRRCCGRWHRAGGRRGHRAAGRGHAQAPAGL